MSDFVDYKLRLYSGIISLTASAILITGCTSDPITLPKSEQYSREFIKTFGVFDRTHDWNHATQATVTVITTRPTEVTVMADYEGRRYIFGTFANVSGEHTLTVDIPKGVNDLIVSANGLNHNARPGDTVELSDERGKSRTFGQEGTQGPITFNVTENTRVFPRSAIKSYIDAVEEEKMNIGKKVDGDSIVSDFYFVGEGPEHPITFYPLYWNTSSYHALGVYWLNDDGKLDSDCMMDLYYTKSGELQYLNEGDPEFPSTEDFHYTCSHKDLAEGEICPEHNAIVKIATDTIIAYPNINNPYYSVKYTGHYHTKIIPIPDGWKFWTTDNHTYDIDKVNKIKTKGITLNVKKGVKYGFYLKVSEYNSLNPDRRKLTEEELHGLTKKVISNNNWDHDLEYYEKDGIKYFNDDVVYHIVFSQSIRNREFGTPEGAEDKFKCIQQRHIHNNQWGNVSDDHKYDQAAHLTLDVGDQTYSYFSFEDWKIGVPDLNDLVFIFDDNYKPTYPPTPEVWEWIVACEDLGTDDFDFNDVVFSVSYPITDVATGKKTVTIKALASGGVLPVYLYYGGEDLYHRLIPEGCESTEGEFHSWFDAKPGQIINASSIRREGKSITIAVPDDFTMACTTKADDGNMGGFRVAVHHPDGTVIISASNPNVEEQIGAAPQMICVPATWKWPREHVFIKRVYSGFTDWCRDPDINNHWHETLDGSGYWER